MNCKNGTCVASLLACVALGAAGTAFVLPAFSQDGNADPAAMMEQWVKANAPGKEHALMLKNMVGEWDAKATFWPAPGAPAMESSATASVTPMFGGRFVEMTFTGDMMGQPFHGKSFSGFDNASKKFQSIWFDSSSTNIMMNTGAQAGDNSLTWSGSYSDVMTGEQKNTRCVDTFANGTWTFEMFETGSDGQENKTMQIVYTRKANAQNAPVNQIEDRVKYMQEKQERINSGN
jgi:hypothetical protein